MTPIFSRWPADGIAATRCGGAADNSPVVGSHEPLARDVLCGGPPNLLAMIDSTHNVSEAEIGAAELLFQGNLFVQRALEFPVSIAAPIALAHGFGSSMTAAVRHYLDYHPDPVAVLLAGRYARSSGRLPIWRAHESPSCARRFGPALDCFPLGLPAREGDSDPIAGIVRQALEDGDIASVEIQLRDLRGEARGFIAEAFFNQRLLMLMLTDSAVANRLSRKLEGRIV
jgi:hypothetical protein